MNDHEKDVIRERRIDEEYQRIWKDELADIFSHQSDKLADMVQEQLTEEEIKELFGKSCDLDLVLKMSGIFRAHLFAAHEEALDKAIDEVERLDMLEEDDRIVRETML